MIFLHTFGCSLLSTRQESIQRGEDHPIDPQLRQRLEDALAVQREHHAVLRQLERHLDSALNWKHLDWNQHRHNIEDPIRLMLLPKISLRKFKN